MLSEWHLQAACRGRRPGDFVQGPKFDYAIHSRDLRVVPREPRVFGVSR